MIPHEQFVTEFSSALGKLPESVIIKMPRHEAGISMSGLGRCARQQYLRKSETSWPALMGFAAQALVESALIEMGYTIFEYEVEFAGMTGHPDGVLTGYDLDEPVVWDNKGRGYYQLGLILRDGLKEADYPSWLQMQCYMHATNIPQALVTLVPFDLGAARLELKKKKLENDPLINRIIVDRVDICEFIEDRAAALRFCVENEVLPMAEFDPATTNFPCNYCEVKDACIVAGVPGFVVPK